MTDHVGGAGEICKRTGVTLVAVYEQASYRAGQGVEKIQPGNPGGGIDLKSSNSGLPSRPEFPLSVHGSDESNRDYIATSDAVLDILCPSQKNILRRVDARKNAGQTYAKKAFRAETHCLSAGALA